MQPWWAEETSFKNIEKSFRFFKNNKKITVLWFGTTQGWVNNDRIFIFLGDLFLSYRTGDKLWDFDEWVRDASGYWCSPHTLGQHSNRWSRQLICARTHTHTHTHTHPCIHAQTHNTTYAHNYTYPLQTKPFQLMPGAWERDRSETRERQQRDSSGSHRMC